VRRLRLLLVSKEGIEGSQERILIH
jgi:hypothetical protein